MGLGAFLMGEGFFGRSMGVREKAKLGFESYNRDLKKWCEGYKNTD
jgi:hypothetical protein